MLLEIGAPHAIPMLQLAYFGIQRCLDRGCTCDKRKSKKLLQSEYEELYIGPEFLLDSRLAQIVAIVWVTFMYSSTLPILFPITVINFFIIFWVDKWLLLRFYKTPKNFDEQSILFSISEMQLAFIFHFIIGIIAYSNDRILSKSEAIGFLKTVVEDPISGAKSILSILDLSRYNSFHTILFFTGNLFIFLLMILKETILDWILSTFKCFNSLQKKFEQMDALSDDYLEVMSLRFLISEYERTKQEK